MDTLSVPAMKTVSIELPAADYNLLKALSKKMGWATKIVKTKKSELDLALEDVRKGDLKSFDSVDDFMDYLNS